jgi:dolichyl-phosphate-mannose--protein O-mannosyl transferase
LLLWLGLIGYALYNYAFYLLGAALNAFFLIYVVAVVLAVVVLILVLSQLDTRRVADSLRPTAPVRLIGGSLVFIGIGLAFVWIGMWAAYVRRQTDAC